MDIPILRYIDILIGLSVLVFLGATVVASVTQFVLWNVRARSRKLTWAIGDLLGELAPNLDAFERRLAAERLLRHPLLKSRSTPVDGFYNLVANAWRTCGANTSPPLDNVAPPEAIARGELAMILIEWVAGEGPLVDPPQPRPGDHRNYRWKKLWKDLRRKLRRSLKSSGLTDPAGALRAVRFKALENERARPRFPASLWLDHALLDETPSDFLGKLFASFDNAMSRSSDAFKVLAKKTSAIVALLTVSMLQVDAFNLVERLSVDDALRASLVEEAEALTERIENPEADANSVASATRKRSEIRESLELLYEPRYELIPGEPIWVSWSSGTLGPRIPGILFAWLLVSLGAPFWFDLMKNLLKMRSLVASKDERERRQRETVLTTRGEGSSSSPMMRTPQSKDDEAGNLADTGAVG